MFEKAKEIDFLNNEHLDPKLLEQLKSKKPSELGDFLKGIDERFNGSIREKNGKLSAEILNMQITDKDGEIKAYSVALGDNAFNLSKDEFSSRYELKDFDKSKHLEDKKNEHDRKFDAGDFMFQKATKFSLLENKNLDPETLKLFENKNPDEALQILKTLDSKFREKNDKELTYPKRDERINFSLEVGGEKFNVSMQLGAGMLDKGLGDLLKTSSPNSRDKNIDNLLEKTTPVDRIKATDKEKKKEAEKKEVGLLDKTRDSIAKGAENIATIRTGDAHVDEILHITGNLLKDIIKPNAKPKEHTKPKDRAISR